MGNKKKFDKIERNETYYEAYGEENGSEESIKKKEKNEKKKKILDMDPTVVPEKKEPSSKFTYTKEKRTSPDVYEPAIKAEKPSNSPFVFVLIALCLVFAAKLLSINGVFDSLSENAAVTVSVLVYAVVYLVPVAVYMIVRYKHIGLNNIRGFSPSKMPFTFVCLGLVLSLTALQKYAISYMFSYSDSTSIIGGSLVLTIFVSALLPAVCEELLVRGIFQYEISSYAGGFCGVIAGAVVFGLLHFDIRYFFVYFVAGLVLGALTHVTGSVFPAMIVHFLNNTLSILFSGKLSFVAAERIGGTLLMIMLAVLCFIFLIIALQMAEGMCMSKAAEYYEKDKQQEDFSSGRKREAMLLTAKGGRTFSRSIKVFANPVFLVSVAVFIVVAATIINLQ